MLSVPAIPRDCVLRARSVLTMAGEKPARGANVFAPLRGWLDNPEIVVRDGKIARISAASGVRENLPAIDLGDVRVIPPIANAHTHTQLSWLAGKTLWGAGFANWLKSLLTSLLPPRPFFAHEALAMAADELRRSGTYWLGDVGGSIPGALAAAAYALSDFETVHFCEWFGWQDFPGPWPSRCAAEVIHVRYSSPAAHALYSVSETILRKARSWCRANGAVFSFHLAESPEESEQLLDGRGALYDIYRENVLPPDWRPPKLTPLEYAIKLDLLGEGTLAAHGVWLTKKEIARFGASGAAICLCPRSNRNLSAGFPAVADWFSSSALVCLGTDGLTSNADLDARREALFLRDEYDVPVEALLRALTVNGAAALGFDPARAVLREGLPARFSLLPLDFWPEN